MIKIAITAPDYSYSERSTEDLKRAMPSFVMVIIATIGIFWLSVNNVPAGTTYWFLLSFGIFTLFLAGLFTKSTHRQYEIPIASSIHAFVILFLFGWLLPIALFFIPKLFGAKSIVTAKYFVPLAFGGAAEGIGAQSFAVLSTVASPFWKSFIIVFTAGTIEPFSVGFSAVIAGILIGYTVRKLSTLNFGEEGNKWFDFGFAMIFSIVFFVIIHKLNDSYVLLGMFVAAGVFRLIMNFSIYFLNLFLAFLFGFHQASNSLAIGISNTFAGFASHPAGFLILAFYALIIFHFIIKIKKFPETSKEILNNIGL